MKSIHYLFVLGLIASITSCAQSVKTDATNAGLKLPKGFTAIIVADGLGAARHIAVASNGDIFVKLEKLKDGKGIYLLHDANNDGTAEQKFGFGNYIGTGMYLKDGYLYASSNEEVYRYKLGADNKPLDP